VATMETLGEDGVTVEGSGLISLVELQTLLKKTKGTIRTSEERRNDHVTNLSVNDILAEGLDTLDDLTTRIDKLNPTGKHIKIAPGMSFKVGKPTGEDFNVGTIVSVGASSLKIRNTLGQTEELSFTRFAEVFEKGE